MRLNGKVALITGGAGSMGAVTAKLFAAEGAKVAIADTLQAEGEQVAAEINKTNAQAKFIKLDVTDETGWRAAVEATVKAFGKLDILVNNAGISGSAVEDFYSTEAWDKLMNINAKGVFLGMKYAIPAMQKAGGGAIVNISSVSGFAGQAGVHMGYNASKGAVRIMSKTAAVQHARDNIRVNSVHPGLMPPMRTSGRTADPKTREKMLQSVPLRRAGRPEEVGYASLFLASDEASYITGTELVVDGGWLAM
jgi:NAD(P)-dependent dehydrogenase (short-subunit alcohol dehydrogenase family)